MSDAIHQFIEAYTHLNKSNLSSLQSIYHPKFLFEDPVRACEGWDALHFHLKTMYENTTHCSFVIKTWTGDEEQAFLQWSLTFAHPQFFQGDRTEVEGCSRIEFTEGLVSYHRDFFDLGEMVYEGLPFIGYLIRRIKNRLRT